MRWPFLVLGAMADVIFAQPAAASPRAAVPEVTSIELVYEPDQKTSKKATKKSKQTPAPSAAQKS